MRRLRDRDAIITVEGIIFRVYGYDHPPEAYICDVEYAPSSIYKSTDPRAPREGRGEKYYKFYADEGLKFVRKNYPKYLVYYGLLGADLVGVREEDIGRVLKPELKFRELMSEGSKDALIDALNSVFKEISDGTSLSINDFGVFGSLLHDFYHPNYSDLDLIIYGRKELRELREFLKDTYGSGGILENEFSGPNAVSGKTWRFRNYGLEEYVRHQRRKLIYAVYVGGEVRKRIKVEFEPVKRWEEVEGCYRPGSRVRRVGWIKALARIIDDSNSPFIPSIYGIEVEKVLEGEKFDDIVRIISYVEEFRMQAFKDELVYVEGNLEEVLSPNGSFHQITLTYCDRYYDQVLKVV
ncbi:nucleotidyltransferase domain-containing protein [Candidatus Bathyarchaeota archaeon]|nr:nucleotidyltransferase domain-containing protein [Candidatus Bathyarchaeota archaeon]